MFIRRNFLVYNWNVSRKKKCWLYEGVLVPHNGQFNYLSIKVSTNKRDEVKYDAANDSWERKNKIQTII